MSVPARPTVAELVHAGRPLLIAHRGNSSIAPENTLPAFASAITLGADVVELDYVHSADGVPVVFHDKTLERTTNGSVLWGEGAKASPATKTLAELKQLDAGSWFAPQFVGIEVPTLAEALRTICARSLVMIERKVGDAATCVELLRAEDCMARATVHAFDWAYLAECHRLAPELMLGALGDGPIDDDRLAAAAAVGATIIGWKQVDLTPHDIEAIHRHGLKAWAWTVDDPQRAQELLAAGLDGLITNVPATMLSLVRAC